MAIDPLPFSELLGIKLLSVAPERVEGELAVRDDLCTRPAVLHGGALMAHADTLGAIATVHHLPALELRAHAPGQHGEQHHPPHDEIDSEPGRYGHWRRSVLCRLSSGQACSISTRVPQKSLGCRNSTGLPCAPILG